MSAKAQPEKKANAASASQNSSKNIFNLPTLDSRLATLLACALIIAATLFVYKPAWHAGFVWDDDDMLTENAAVKGALSEIWLESKPPFLSTKFYDYIPLTLTWYWIEARLWEKNPTETITHATDYRLTNILLHAL